MSWSRAIAILMGIGVATLLILAVFQAEKQKNEAKDALFESGYRLGHCTAQGGQIISDDICAKDGQIIDIPPRP
jgi:hypothetical protein